jgi:DNA-binding MarR family transcriptional regulator
MKDTHASALRAAGETGAMRCPQLVLLALRNRRGQPMTLTALCRATGKTSQAVTMAVEKLEKGGLVVKRNPQDDLRTRNVYLTDEGNDRAAEMSAALRVLGDLLGEIYKSGRD